MSSPKKEQRPLLFTEEVSDEELRPYRYNRYYHKRYRQMGYKGRAKYTVEGAAAIISRWPEHWSSVTFWWFALGVIAITTFILYNGLMMFSILPSVYSKAVPYANKPVATVKKSPPLHEVFMHLFVDREILDFHTYLLPITQLSNKYTDFKFNFYIIDTDTSEDISEISSEENNKLALKSLWPEKPNQGKQTKNQNNINIVHTTLSKYMNNSPVRKSWKNLQPQLLEFLVRATSIWERGGITFNPKILLPSLHNNVYMENLHRILKRYGKDDKKLNVIVNNTENRNNESNKARTVIPKKQPNNIRDIINALESENNSYNVPQHNLTEEEDIHVPIMTRSWRKLLAIDILQNESQSDIKNIDLLPHENSTKKILVNNGKEHSSKEVTTSNINNPTNAIPLFLKILFNGLNYNNKIGNFTKNMDNSSEVLITSEKDINSTSPYTSKGLFQNINMPVIITADGVEKENIQTSSEKISAKSEVFEIAPLTIDLKGNIIATEIGCHAFLGSVFSNAVHFGGELLTDFIIKELTHFCKGLLSTCKGIDVILL